jgi:hypothetical protein
VTVQVTSAVAALPEAVAFGELQVGKSVEQKVTLKSGTGAPFKILQINGLDDELKAVVQQSESSAVQTVILAAHPNKLGGFHRTVEIVTDNPEQPKIIVPVTAKVIQQ